MPDLVIKPTAGSGNKLILQDQGGGTGAIIENATITVPVLKLTPGSAPGSPAEGQMYYNSTTKRSYIYNGSNWQSMADFSRATGGIISSYTDGGSTYVVHKFLASGLFTPLSAFSIDYLLVAGGGAGGQNYGGGGGAGGFLTSSSAVAVTAQVYTITVGTGGAANTGGNASSIVPVSGTTYTANGGGRGGKYLSAGNLQAAGGGGSGGGAGSASGGPWVGGSGTAGQGNDGGTYSGGNNGYQAPGGGGAGAVGENQSGAGGNGGKGGVGKSTLMGLSADASYKLLSSIDAGHAINDARYFAGGGGGSGYVGGGETGFQGIGGYGGGGLGGAQINPPYLMAEPGLPNTGGGGGGCGASTVASGDGYESNNERGGSGIVIIRYAI